VEVLAKVTEQIETVTVGKSEVEDDHARLGRFDGDRSGCVRLGALDRVASMLQDHLQQLTDERVVLDDE
jgi:hypothetical protein